MIPTGYIASCVVQELIDAEKHLKTMMPGVNPHDVIGVVADIVGRHELCADCGHAKVNPYFHHEAPGTNWGAAIHNFKEPKL